MTDYSELKRLAEALVSALNEYNSDDCSKHRLDAWSAADDALQNAAGPEVILALIAENERLERLAESRLLNWEAEGRALLEACSDRNQLKADNEALRKDADRYRWLRSQHWNESDMAVACHPKKSVKLGFDCPSGERLDHAIDAAMGKGEQA